MKKIIFILLVVLMAMPAFSEGGSNAYWDGIKAVKVTGFDVTGRNNFDLRVMTNADDLLNDTITPHDRITWAYLNESDPNYKTYLSMLTLAFAMDYTVTLYVKEVPYDAGNDKYFAHIEYLVIRK